MIVDEVLYERLATTTVLVGGLPQPDRRQHLCPVVDVDEHRRGVTRTGDGSLRVAVNFNTLANMKLTLL